MSSCGKLSLPERFAVMRDWAKIAYARPRGILVAHSAELGYETAMTRCIDSHAHLDHEDFAGEVPAVLERAAGAGVDRIICVASTLASTRACIALAEQYPQLFATAGIHPHDAARAGDSDLTEVEELAAHPRVVAIGETGLDYHYDFSPRPIQRDYLARAVELALRVGKPLVVHVREAHQDAEEILGRFSSARGQGVIHCYTGDRAQAERYLELGFHLSFSGIVTFPKSREIQEAAAAVPRDRLLVETDAPYLAPVPHRGQRNEPALVLKTAEYLARLRGCTIEEMLALTAENARTLFSLPTG